jgi:hypothetical protein
MRRYVMVLITVQLLLLIPSTASAAVATHVTTPADGTRLVVDQSSPPSIHIAGDATGTSGAVDLYCVSSQIGGAVDARIIDDNVPVTSNAFATSPDPAMLTTSGLCEIVAVDHTSPAPTDNLDLAGLTGSKVYEAFDSTPQQTGGKDYDFYVPTFGTGGELDFYSFGSCGLGYGALVQMHEYDGELFDCNGWADFQDPTASAPAPTIVVDTHPAYAPYYIGSQVPLSTKPGWTGITHAVTDEGGTWHLTSTEGIFKCASGDDFPPTSCTAFASSGVGLTADYTTSADNRSVRQTLRFASLDGQQHSLSVMLNQESFWQSDWFFPGTGGFAPFANGEDPSSIAHAPATIRQQRHTNPTPESITKGVGAITYASTPSSETFFDPDVEFVQRYTNLTIPAGKAVRLMFVYSMNATSAGLDGQVAAAEASIGAPPAISVTSLPNATAVAYTLTGTVNAPEVLNGLTINDQPVTVAGDGGFSVPVTLAAGANQLTLSATDELSRTTTTPFTVTLSTGGPPPPTGTNPLAVVFGKSAKPKLKGRVLTTGYTASCPGTGPSCSITAAATIGRKKAGSGKATVNAGAKATIKVKLSKAAANQLKRKHKLKLSLKLTGKRTGAATTTTKRTLALKKKR